MSIVIKINESVASQRVVPLPPLVQSNGTSACTNESGNTFFFSVGGIYYGSGGSISAVSSAIGLYECLFSASKVSVLGQGAVHYSSGTALPARTPIEIVKYDSYDSMRYGLLALPNAAAEASGGLITFGTSTGQLHTSAGSVGLKAQTHSQATIGGINNILPGTYSGVSVEASNLKPGTYSGVTVGINNIAGGDYSSVTVQGVKRVNSSVTPADATYSAITLRLDSYDYSSKVTVGVGNILGASYSGVTIQGVSNTSSAAALVSDITGGVWYAGTRSGVTIDGVNRVNSSVTIANAAYSGVTVRLDIAQSFSGVTIDGVKFLSTAGERSAASSLLSTNMGNSRLYQEYLWSLRNKIAISGLTATVYLPDDATSAYTLSVTTAASSVQGVDGGGRA